MKYEKMIMSVAVAGAFVAIAPELTEGATRHALIVATESYEKAGRLPPLPGTNQSAARVVDAFVTGGYARERVVLIRNGSPESDMSIAGNDKSRSTAQPSTRANIMRKITELAGRAQAGDTLVIVLIGHGRELEGKSYYCPADASDAALDDPMLADKELIAIPAITAELVKSKAADKLLIVDACRDASLTPARFVTNLATIPSGICIMTSCSRGQSSWISSQISESEAKPIFSHFLGEGISGEADLLGNNDGEVTIHELFTFAYNKTQDAAARIGRTQGPELFSGTGRSFAVSRLVSNPLTRALVTNNAVLEGRQNASLLAEIGLQHVRDGERQFNFEIQKLKNKTSDEIKAGNLFRPIYGEHHDNLCYSLGTYLSPALDFNAECRTAHLARGFIFRASGMYAEALREYQAAREHFDLFIKGDVREIERYLAYKDGTELKDERGDPVLNVAETKISDQVKSIEEVSLFAEPNVKAEVVQPIARDAKVRVERIETVGGKEWLQVVAAGDKSLDRPGWLPREQALWFPEATRIYVPESLMNAKFGDLRGGPAKLEQDQDRMRKIARRAQVVQKIENFEQRYDEKMRGYNQARRIPFVSGYLPNIDGYVKPYTGMAKAYASIPNGYIRTETGYAQISERDALIAGEMARDVKTYYDGLERALLFSGRNLDRAVERRLKVDDSPWKSRREVTRK